MIIEKDPNHDTEKSTDLWHGATLSQPRLSVKKGIPCLGVSTALVGQNLEFTIQTFDEHLLPHLVPTLTVILSQRPRV